MTLAPAAPPARPGVDDRLAVRLLVALAVLAWIASLGLPAYYLHRDAEGPSSGLETLIEGGVFGVLCWGIAVYANLPFAVLAARLFAGKAATGWLVAMLALLLTLPAFNAIPTSWSAGPVIAVDAWGPGAVLWVAALALAGIAGVVRACRGAADQRRWHIALGTLFVLVLGGASLVTHPIHWPRPLAYAFHNDAPAAPTPAASAPTPP